MTGHHDDCVAHPDGPACTLAPRALEDRIRDWQSLAARALTRESGDGRVRATYPNRPEVAQRLAELIDAEKECCSFLVFEVQERGSVLEVELRYPADFAPLLAHEGRT